MKPILKSVICAVMKKIVKKIWIPTLAIIIIAGGMFFYNRPVVLQKAVLMSTPLIFRDKLSKPYDSLPQDVAPPFLDIFYATDRMPTNMAIINPIYYGNNRSSSLSLGLATVQFGDEDMAWNAVEKASFQKDRNIDVPLQITEIKELSTIGNASKFLKHPVNRDADKPDDFMASIKRRLSNSDSKSIYIFVPGFKVDFAYPVLLAAELWYYLGYPGAFIAYSWPSGQRIRDYLSDVETTAFTAQHFRMLLIYLANETDVEAIHILSYSAGARIVSQALHELRLMTHGFSNSKLEKTLKIDQVIFAAPDIDMMLFGARYRDGFEDIARNITIYTNANDTALNWALRFFGWPRLGAPGEMGITPEDLQPYKIFDKTRIIDVAAAEATASGNGHGYFVKSPWVSTDLILTLKYKINPFERGLYKDTKEAIWKFPDTYFQRIKKIVNKNP